MSIPGAQLVRFLEPPVDPFNDMGYAGDPLEHMSVDLLREAFLVYPKETQKGQWFFHKDLIEKFSFEGVISDLDADYPMQVLGVAEKISMAAKLLSQDGTTLTMAQGNRVFTVPAKREWYALSDFRQIVFNQQAK